MAAQQQESATTQKAEREVSRMVVVMVGSFCVCYVPYAALAMYMVNNRDHGLDLRLVTIPAFFSKTACVYNPPIYCFMNKRVGGGTGGRRWGGGLGVRGRVRGGIDGGTDGGGKWGGRDGGDRWDGTDGMGQMGWGQMG